MDALYHKANIINLINVIVAFPVIPGFFVPILLAVSGFVIYIIDVMYNERYDEVIAIYMIGVMLIYLFVLMFIELCLYSSVWIIWTAMVCYQYAAYKVGDENIKKKSFLCSNIMLGIMMLFAAVGIVISVMYGHLINLVLCFHVIILGIPTLVYFLVKRKRILLGIDDQ